MGNNPTPPPPGRGRPKGSVNKSTLEFRDAIVNLLNYAAPEMVQWLKLVAKDDPNKALDHISKLGEYAYPKLARTELTGANGKDLFSREEDAAALAHLKEKLKGKP